MLHLCKLVLVSILMLSFAACSTEMPRVDYEKDYAQGAKFKNGSWDNGKSMGSVHANAGGAIWKDCKELAANSVEEMAMQAKDMGANAIGDISYEFSKSANPACQKRWGLLLVWPFVLTPLFASVPVNGTACKIAGPAATKKSAGIYTLPLSQEAKNEIVQSILQQPEKTQVIVQSLTFERE
ncbi:MAG: hypothetical protein H7222_10705 [Methylotenera sp.]|nr:hypothetical protein [Oligoflexia bacterium]